MTRRPYTPCARRSPGIGCRSWRFRPAIGSPAADCTLEVLHPSAKGLLGRENVNSLVVSAEYRGRRILLTGDLEPPGLNELLADAPLHCDVLLVPHHGSRQSDPRLLSQWSTPTWAVISADRRYDLHEVEGIYQQAGSRVLHTAETGAVTARVDKNGLRVETFVGGSCPR